MSTLKRDAASSLLRSIKKYRDWLEVVMGTSGPTHRSLANGCLCCELMPTPVVTESFVDTHEQTTVTGSGAAHFAGYFTEPGISGLARVPYAEWHFGPVTCKFSLQVSDIANPTSTVTLEVTWGNYREFETFEITALSYDVTASVSLPCRLLARIKSFPRTNRETGASWGPRPRWSDPTKHDAVDLRDYKSADLDWYTWDRDGAGEATITAFGHTLTVPIVGRPLKVGAGLASMNHIDPRGESYGTSWLEASFFGSPVLPEYDEPYWYKTAPPNDWSDGGRAWTSGHRISIQNLGTLPTMRDCYLDLLDLQPDRAIGVDLDLVHPAPGVSYPASSFVAGPLDGPDWSPLDPNSVVAEYPIGGGALGVDSPGSWSGTGSAYYVAAGGGFDAPISGYTDILDHSDNTIGTPAIGLGYSPTALDAAGVSGDSWRCPLRLPVGSASWNAMRIRLKSGATEGTAQPVWGSANGNTTVTAGHVTGTGTLLARTTLDETWPIGEYRYLSISLRGAAAGQTITLKVGSKEWTATVGTSAQAVVFDLAGPSNASGFDTTTTKKQAQAAAGWGWGLEAPATLDLESAGEFWIGRTELSYHQEPGLLLVGETLARWDERWHSGELTLWEGEPYAEALQVYLQRGLLLIADGRTELDEEWGLVADGFENRGNRTYDRYLALNISDVIRAANQRHAIGGRGLVSIQNLAPSRYAVWSGWDGFTWIDAANFFNNQTESFHLSPTRLSIGGGTVEYVLSASYCVDRVVPGVGVSKTFSSSKWLGAGLHGLTRPPESSVGAGSESVTSEENGLWAVQAPANASAAITGGWDGSPAAETVEGTLMRAAVRK